MSCPISDYRKPLLTKMSRTDTSMPIKIVDRFERTGSIIGPGNTKPGIVQLGHPAPCRPHVVHVNQVQSGCS